MERLTVHDLTWSPETYYCRHHLPTFTDKKDKSITRVTLTYPTKPASQYCAHSSAAVRAKLRPHVDYCIVYAYKAVPIYQRDGERERIVVTNRTTSKAEQLRTPLVVTKSMSRVPVAGAHVPGRY